jgi:hypothetical protein
VGSVSLNAMAQIALRKTMLTVGPLPSSVANALGFAFSLLLNPWFLAGMTCYALSKGIRIFLSRRECQPDPDCRDRTDLLRHSRSFPEYLNSYAARHYGGSGFSGAALTYQLLERGTGLSISI